MADVGRELPVGGMGKMTFTQLLIVYGIFNVLALPISLAGPGRFMMVQGAFGYLVLIGLTIYWGPILWSRAG